MPSKKYTDLDLRQNQLLQSVFETVSSFPSGAREGRYVYRIDKKSVYVCINDTIDTTLPEAWSLVGGEELQNLIDGSADSFYAFNLSGGIDLSSGFIDIPFSKIEINGSSFSVETGADEEVIFLNDGTYEIAYNIEATATGILDSRAEARLQILEPDTGSSFSTIEDSVSSLTFSISEENKASSTITIQKVITAGTKIKLQTGRIFGVSTILTEANSCSISIKSCSGLDSVGGGGSITVTDEGTLVTSNATTLNFRGVDVEATQSGSITNIDIPAPPIPSHFNTSDGVGVSSVSDPSTVQRNLADSTEYEPGSFIPGTLSATLRDTLLSFDSLIDVTFDDLVSTIEVNVLSPSTGNYESRITPVITGDTDTTVDGIRIAVSSFAVNGSKYKAFIDVETDLSTIISNGSSSSGVFQVQIIHHSGGNDYEYLSPNIFFDSEPNVAALTGVGILENTPVIKTLSGVNFYDLGSTFDLSISDIDFINDDSYPTDFINLESNEYGIADEDLEGSDLTGWTINSGNQNSSYSATKSITQASFRAIITDANIRARVVDWTNGPWVNSTDKNLLVDTFGITATDINEPFDDESKRRTSSFGTWSSTTLLAPNELQVIGGSLRRQYNDWTIYTPTNTADYTSSTANQFYYRGFRHFGVSHSNGLFNITGVTENDITNDDILIEISLNGTDWYNCNEEYVGGALSDGDGCRIFADTVQMPSLHFTLGTGGFTSATTGPDGWGIYMRLSMPDGSSVICNSIEITDWV